MPSRSPSRLQCLREMYGLPSDWQMLTSVPIEGGWLIRGAVYSITFLKGPRAGETDYSRPSEGTAQEIELPDDFFADWLALWECETGRCAACNGQTTVLLEWTRRGGAVMQICPYCDGSGLTRGKEEAA